MRSFTFDVAALALLAAIALIGHVRAEPLTTRTFQDSMGRTVLRRTAIRPHSETAWAAKLAELCGAAVVRRSTIALVGR
jgi:hypothetical protein